jgi:SnoaL-like domain
MAAPAPSSSSHPCCGSVLEGRVITGPRHDGPTVCSACPLERGAAAGPREHRRMGNREACHGCTKSGASLEGHINEDANIQVVRQLYDTFGRGDIDTILQAVADDVEWHQPGPTDVLPWAGTRHGRAQVAQFFTAVSQTLGSCSLSPGRSWRMTIRWWSSAMRGRWPSR